MAGPGGVSAAAFGSPPGHSISTAFLVLSGESRLLVVSGLAGRYGASAKEETPDPKQAYAPFEWPQPGRLLYWGRAMYGAASNNASLVPNPFTYLNSVLVAAS